MKYISLFETYKIIDMDVDNLQSICRKLKLDYSKIKFLSSGSYGDAYKIGGKVLKLTSDENEANDAYSTLKNHQEGVIKYYSVNKYILNGKKVYVILMDYAKPLDRIKGSRRGMSLSNFKNLIQSLCTIVRSKWGVSREKYLGYTHQFQKDEEMVWVNKFWELYTKIENLSNYPDLHYNNLGLDINGDLVLFDFNKFSFPLFDIKPNLWKVKSLSESLDNVDTESDIKDYFMNLIDKDYKVSVKKILPHRIEYLGGSWKDIAYSTNTIKKGILPSEIIKCFNEVIQEFIPIQNRFESDGFVSNGQITLTKNEGYSYQDNGVSRYRSNKFTNYSIGSVSNKGINHVETIEEIEKINKGDTQDFIRYDLQMEFTIRKADVKP